MNERQLYRIHLEIEGQIDPEYFTILAHHVEVLRSKNNPILDVVLASYDHAFSSYTKHRAQLEALAGREFAAKTTSEEETLVITLMLVACSELNQWETLRDLIFQLYVNFGGEPEIFILEPAHKA